MMAASVVAPGGKKRLNASWHWSGPPRLLHVDYNSYLIHDIQSKLIHSLSNARRMCLKDKEFTVDITLNLQVDMTLDRKSTVIKNEAMSKSESRKQQVKGKVKDRLLTSKHEVEIEPEKDDNEYEEVNVQMEAPSTEQISLTEDDVTSQPSNLPCMSGTRLLITYLFL